MGLIAGSASSPLSTASVSSWERWKALTPHLKIDDSESSITTCFRVPRRRASSRYPDVVDSAGWATLVGVGIAVGVVGVLSAVGRLPRNGIEGIRISSTMASNEAWERGHLAAAPWLVLAALANLLIAGGLWAWRPATGVVPGVVAGGTVLTVSLVIASAVSAHMAAR